MSSYIPAGLLSVWFIAGSLQADAQQSSPARQAFDQGVRLEKSSPALAFDFFQRSASLAEGSDRSLYFASILKEDHLGYELKGDFQRRSRATLARAIRSLPTDNVNDLQTAELFYYYGASLIDPDSTSIYFLKSLEIRKTLLGDKSEQTAECYYALGDINKYSLYDFDKAEAYYEKALEIWEGTSPPNEYRLVRIYYSLAATNRSQGDFEKALSYGFRALAMAIKEKNADLIGRTYSILGNIYRDVGQYDSARRVYESAIALTTQIEGRKQTEKLAVFYQGLGEVLKKQHQYDQALTNYHRALTIFLTVEITEHNIFLHCLEQMGEIYSIKNQDDEAIKFYRKSLRAHRDLNLLKSGSASELCRYMGDLFLKERKIDSALFYYQRALICAVRNFDSPDFGINPVSDSVELSDFVYKGLLGKAASLMAAFSISKNEANASNALKCYALAERVLSRARNSLDLEDAKWAFLETNFDVYEKCIEASYALHRYARHDSLLGVAYHYFEGSKSRSLADAVQQAERFNTDVVNEPLLRERKMMGEEMLKLHDQLKKQHDVAKIEVIRNTIVDLDRKMKRNENEVRKKYPSYFDVKYEYFVPSVREVQELIKQKNATLLEYFWGNRSVYAMCIAQNKVSFIRLGSTDSIALPIRRLMKSFEPGQSGLDLASFQQFSNDAHQVYQLLVGPFEQEMASKRIIVIPDGLVATLPFEVLIVAPTPRTAVNYRDLDYLINHHSTAYSFSATFLLHQKPRPISNPALLAFGLTGSGDNTDESGGASELNSLSRKFPSGQFFTGARATKQVFKSRAADFDVIHLAVHGRGDIEGDNSASLFFAEANDSVHEGEFHWYELYSMRLKAALTVLSACESGVGESYRGEGMQSMANAFVYAGCDNIVLGLWKVNDQVSVRLMERFYEGLGLGRPVDEALREAKLDYLKNSDEFTAQPKFWGSLVAYGDQQIIEKKWGAWFFVSSALIFLLLVATLFLLRRIVRAVFRPA